ncbi:MAG: ribonuclease HII [Parcubacteria group bacterium]|nr:ribonuclease HII [Parcubacteria group bacterium]MBI4457411.1 ribonuclease HII [Candidatus Uhrbacteria bacterium]
MVAVRLPTFHEERALLAAGFTIVAGVDEAGCGCWAGPVFAAAVILPFDSRIGLIRDSKTLSLTQRLRVVEDVKREAAAWAVGTASAAEVDSLNIRRAGALAMRRAVEGLAMAPQFVLIDAFAIPGLAIPSKNIVKGDLKIKSIAAASVIAKVARDQHMAEVDARFPGYGFAGHKGYGTRQHQEALRRLGPCAEHRMSYAPIKACMQNAHQKTEP